MIKVEKQGDLTKYEKRIESEIKPKIPERLRNQLVIPNGSGETLYAGEMRLRLSKNCLDVISDVRLARFDRRIAISTGKPISRSKLVSLFPLDYILINTFKSAGDKLKWFFKTGYNNYLPVIQSFRTLPLVNSGPDYIYRTAYFPRVNCSRNYEALVDTAAKKHWEISKELIQQIFGPMEKEMDIIAWLVERLAGEKRWHWGDEIKLMYHSKGCTQYEKTSMRYDLCGNETAMYRIPQLS